MIFVAPKNFKRGRLIANKYTVLDLLIAIIGVLITLLLEIMFLLSGLQDTVGKNIAIATILLLPCLPRPSSCGQHADRQKSKYFN